MPDEMKDYFFIVDLTKKLKATDCTKWPERDYWQIVVGLAQAQQLAIINTHLAELVKLKKSKMEY